MLFKSFGDSKGGHVYLAGNQDQLIECDIETLKHVRTVDIFEGDRGLKNCYYMKEHPKFLCMADSEGKVCFELDGRCSHRLVFTLDCPARLGPATSASRIQAHVVHFVAGRLRQLSCHLLTFLPVPDDI